MSSEVRGALSQVERSVIDERDRLVALYREAADPDERRRLLGQIQDVMKRYDAMRRGRWERGEIK